MAKFISFTDDLYNYMIECRSRRVDPVLDDLRAETEKLGPISGMLISHEQGSFMTLLVQLLNVKRAVEVGTFTGYSSTCIARGLGEGGTLRCFDVNKEWTDIAQKAWKKAGVADRITLTLGPGVETLPALPSEPELDLVFIDADKTNYDVYYELLLPRVRPNGLIIFDNMLWHGKLVTAEKDTPDAVAINKLNRKLADDARVESVLIAVADGLHLVRKK